MNKKTEAKFEEARKKLSDSFSNLEKTIKQKLEDSVIQARMVHISEEDASSYEAKIIEQENLIESLNNEINYLQNQLSETGKEIEFLKEKNEVLARRVEKIRFQQYDLVEEIEADILKIEELIKDEEKA